jgi:hypothetical protein
MRQVMALRQALLSGDSNASTLSDIDLLDPLELQLCEVEAYLTSKQFHKRIDWFSLKSDFEKMLVLNDRVINTEWALEYLVYKPGAHVAAPIFRIDSMPLAHMPGDATTLGSGLPNDEETYQQELAANDYHAAMEEEVDAIARMRRHEHHQRIQHTLLEQYGSSGNLSGVGSGAGVRSHRAFTNAPKNERPAVPQVVFPLAGESVFSLEHDGSRSPHLGSEPSPRTLTIPQATLAITALQRFRERSSSFNSTSSLGAGANPHNPHNAHNAQTGVRKKKLATQSRVRVVSFAATENLMSRRSSQPRSPSFLSPIMQRRPVHSSGNATDEEGAGEHEENMHHTSGSFSQHSIPHPSEEETPQMMHPPAERLSLSLSLSEAIPHISSASEEERSHSVE